MTITAKELAKKLNLSATAVSMALNNKPGVSTETRQLVIEAAEKYEYDFTKLSFKKNRHGSVYIVEYRTHNAIMSYSPIENEITNGIAVECQHAGYGLKTINIYEKNSDLQKHLEDIRISDCVGIILMGTEMTKEICRLFLQLPMPMVLLDSYYDSVECNSVLINNEQGAYLAASYLISRCGQQPGYLSSSYPIANFEKRRIGFEKAVREYGMSVSKCITHKLSPSIEGAEADMLEIIERKDELAHCYFAENDFIAIGAMKALKLRGYKLPEDIAMIGFDNISESRIIEPSLTTINVPRQYMGRIAARTIINAINEPVPFTVKTEITTNLVKRFSV